MVPRKKNCVHLTPRHTFTVPLLCITSVMDGWVSDVHTRLFLITSPHRTVCHLVTCHTVSHTFSSNKGKGGTRVTWNNSSRGWGATEVRRTDLRNIFQSLGERSQTATLHITLNVDGTPLVSRSHTHPSHSHTSRLLTSSLSLNL